MKSEKELIESKLAYIRDNIFDESDFISDDGCDLLSSYVGSPYEVLCGMEQKIIRQQKENEQIKGAYKDREGDVEALNKEVEKAVQIFKMIKTTKTWNDWCRNGLNKQINEFLEGQKFVD